MKHILIKLNKTEKIKGASFTKRVLTNVLTKIIPAANPDFEDIFDNITYFKIEFNEGENYIEREIGFSSNDTPISIFPYNNNYGFLVDNTYKSVTDFYDYYKCSEISVIEFELDWKEAEKSIQTSL